MAQSDYFLKIDGLEGESLDDSLKGHIHLSSYHMGAANRGSGQQGGGSGSSKVQVNDIQCTKAADKASPGLFIACCTGRHFPSATLTIRKAGENPHHYLVFKMTNVLVSSFTSKSHHAGGIAQESMSLNFSKIEMSYAPQNSDGSGGAKIVKTFDVAANKAS